MAKTVLLVAAESREFAGPLSPASGKRLGWPIDCAFAWGEWIMVANGPGRLLAAEAVSVALRHRYPDVIVSTGVCGGIAEDLEVGSILVADRVVDGRAREYPALIPSSNRRFRTGTVFSSDRVAVSFSDKRSLRDHGADGVEMEAAAVAERASKEGIPFYCVRSVSDTADEQLVLDFNDLRDSRGRFSRWRIAAAALERPFSRIPALLRLDRNTKAAAKSLGEFLVDCRF